VTGDRNHWLLHALIAQAKAQGPARREITSRMATLTLLRSLKWSHRRYVASVQAFVTHTSRCVTDLTLYRLAVAPSAGP